MKTKSIMSAALSCILLSGCNSLTNNERTNVVKENGSIISTKKSIDSSFVKNKFINIPYQNIKDSQKLDIYLPNEGTGPFPIIIGVHGGGFKFGSKDEAMNQSMLEGTKRGYAVVLINYRLSGTAKFPAAIEDVKSSIRFIKANAEKYNLDPNKIGLWGASAGGNLVALAGVTGNSKIFNNSELGYPEVSTSVQAVVDWFGPINFLTMDSEFVIEGIDGQKHSTPTSFESQYLGKYICEADELVKMSNPETYLDNGDLPPFLIQHGTADRLVPHTQSINFANKLENVELVLLQDAGHGDPSAFDTEENLERVFKFLDKYLK